MLLITLYCLSTILLFIDLEPFKILGVFLGLCYLPGLSIFFIARKEKINFEDLLFAFPTSIGISGFLTIALLFAGVRIFHVQGIIHLTVGVITFFCLAANNRRKGYPVVVFDKKEILFCLFALLLTLIVSIPFFIGPDRGPIAAHAFHHSSFVSQILQGIFPPENPGLGGTTIGYYWGFHALIAALTSHSGFQQLQIIFLLNAIAIFVIFCIAYNFTKYFGLPEKVCYIMPLAVMGLMRSDAGFYFIYKLLSGRLTSLKTLMAKQMLPGEVLDNWLSGITWFDTRLLYLNKFYNISAMPLTISICLSYFLMLLILLRAKSADTKIYPVIFTFIITACIVNYPPLAIVPLFYTPVWASIIFLSAQGVSRERIKEALKILFPYITGILIALPYVLLVMMGRDISSSGQGSILILSFYSQSVKNLVVFLLPSPVIIYGAWIVFKRFSFSREALLLFSGAVLCLALSALTRWPFDNSYKFNYILVFFCALFFMFAMFRWMSMFSGRVAPVLIIAILSLYVFLTPFIVVTSYIVSCLSMDRQLTFIDGHIVYAQDKQKNEAYSWIRDNTPSNSLVMLSYIETSYPCCGVNRNYEAAALSERTQYVIKDTDYTTSNPEYLKRVLMREKLFRNPDDPQVISYFSSLKRPVYLLVEKGLPDVFVVEDRFRHFPEYSGRPFELVFHNDRQRVYKIRTN